MSRKSFLRINDILREDYTTPGGWKENLLFSEMSNYDLGRLTEGGFIVRDSERTHPVFLLKRVERESFEFCPCSSKKYNEDSASYIRKGSATPPAKIPTDKDSYILHFLSFNLNSGSREVDRLPLRGLVAEDDTLALSTKGGAYNEDSFQTVDQQPGMLCRVALVRRAGRKACGASCFAA